MKPYVLIVEDVPDIAELVSLHLQHEGYHTQHVTDAINARKHIDQGKIPDLMVVDWMLPKHTTGIDLVRDLRKNIRTQYIPIILLTAKHQEEDKIEALDAGADDYVTKPFSPKELAARIKAVLRRYTPNRIQDKQNYGSIALDPGQYSISYQNQYIILAPTEFRLLAFFAAHPNRTYSRQELLDHVWGDQAFLEERTIDVHIKRLRRDLLALGMNDWIETIRGLGYRYTPQE
jgi:two-component system phosphate regulon response regulator PhoB